MMKKLVETTNSRIYSHIAEDDNWAIVSPYRSENDESTNEKLMSQFKREVRDSGYGFIQFVSRWVEDGEAFDESSLLIPNCTKEDALKFGKEYHQSSVIVRDDSGCNEICTTNFVDGNHEYNYGDIVRTFNLSGNKVMNYEEAEAIFSKRKGGPASMPKNKTGRKNLKPFRLSEVYEVSQPRPSYFQNGNRRNLIFKSSLNESNTRKAYEVEFCDDRNGVTSSIDTVFADGNYIAEDYIEDCMLNADDEWNEMLSHGKVTLHEIDLQESLFEATKDVSIDKMSKKDRKAFYDKQRNVWERNPVTKTKPSDKIYDRKKFKKDDLNESEGEKQEIVSDKNYHVLHWVTGEDKARDYGNLPGKDIKGMLRGYKYEDDLDMWFSKSGNSGYFITEIKESLDEADEANKETNDNSNGNSSGNSNKCPNCGRNLVKDSTGFHCPVCDKKNNSSEFNTSSISKGAVSEEYEIDDTFDKVDFEPHNKDEHEFEHDDNIKGIEEIKL